MENVIKYFALISIFFHNSLSSTLIKNAEIGLKQDHVMVSMDPRPSPDDYSNPNGYTETELLHFIKVISSRFSQILVDITDLNSTAKISTAVAQFNKYHRTKNIPPSHLWLHIPYKNTSDYNSTIKYLETILSIVDNANSLYQGSMQGVILNQGYITHENDTILQTHLRHIIRIFRNETKFSYKLGVLFPEVKIFSNATSYKAVADALVKIEASCVITYSNPNSQDIESGVNQTIIKHQSILEKITKEVRSLNETQTITPIFRTGYPSTGNNSKGKPHFGDLVNYWKSMGQWAIRNNVTVAMTEAFDVPIRKTQASKSLGWWRLIDDDYQTATEYVFEEKAELNRMELHFDVQRLQEPDDKHILYFRDDKHFDFRVNPKLIVEFNPYLPKGMSGLQLNKTLKLQLNKLAEKFGRLSIRDEDFTKEQFSNASVVLATWNKMKKNGTHLPVFIDTSLVFTPPTHANVTTEERKVIFSKINEIATRANKIHMGTVSLVQASFFKDYDFDKRYNYFGVLVHYHSIYGNGSNSTYKFGVELPLEVCRKRSYTSVVSSILPFVKVITMKIVLGTDELIQRGVVYSVGKYKKNFETCMKKIGAGNGNVIVQFNIGWRDTNIKGSKDYESFLKFWGEMGKWARDMNVDVVMMEAFDNPERKREQGGFGWWEMIKNNTSSEGSLGYDFVEKLKVLRDELPPVSTAEESSDDNDKGIDQITTMRGETGDVSTTTTATNSNETSDVTETIIGTSAETVIISDGGGGNDDTSFLLSWACPTAVAACVCTILAFVLVWKVRKNPRELTKQEVQEFVEGPGKFGDFLGEELYINSRYLAEQYEVSLDTIVFDSVIGFGKFGIVYKAAIDNNTVAVKVPKKTCNKQHYKLMLMEVKIHSNVGHHDNVLQFIGASTKDIKNGMVYLITEYCENGTLYAYLRTLRYNMEATENEEEKKLDDIYELYKFAYEIASGMHYISEKDIIHGDLSTKCILLDGHNNCKIGDFGLSRKLDDNGEYLKKSEQSYPWRWIAVETLKHKIVTGRSDVWSYGVTLWEIFSLGRIPYKNHTQDGFLEKLEKGLRLKRPKYATQSVYDNMMLCWNRNPADRPLFQKQSEYFLLLMKEEYDQINFTKKSLPHNKNKTGSIKNPKQVSVQV